MFKSNNIALNEIANGREQEVPGRKLNAYCNLNASTDPNYYIISLYINLLYFTFLPLFLCL